MAKKSGFAMDHRFVLNDGTEFEVPSNIVDVVRFERATNEAYMDAASSNIKMSTLMWVGWAAACRAKKVPKEGRAKFEMFLPLVADYEPMFPDPEEEPADDDEDEAGDSDPTQSDQQVESSSVSPS